MGFLNLLKKKPNIIMIIMDGTRKDATDRLPFYRELKKEAVFFSSMITYAPYTVASLHATLSGMYGNQNGVNGYYKSYSFDKENCFTLAQYLKGVGYHTEMDSLNENVAPSQGFDKFRVHDEFKDNLLLRHLEIIQQIKKFENFFLVLHYTKIHKELVTNVAKKYTDFDKEYFNNKENNFSEYLKWAESGTEYLNGIINKLKELELYDNSIIFIFSDHGSSVGDRIGEKMYGSFLYDYTIKCFLYVIGKKLPKNTSINNLVRSIDLMPTILEILGIKEKTNYKELQGKSFMSVIANPKEERIAYSETGGLGGPTPSPEIHNSASIRTNAWKLIYNKANNKKELYNLEKDQLEENNLAGKNLAVEKELWEEVQKYGN